MTCYIEGFATWMEISLHEDSPTKMTSWWLSDYYNLILKVKGKKTCVLEYLFLEIFVYLYCESSKFKIYVTRILIYVDSQLQRNEVMWYVVFYWWIQLFKKFMRSWKRVSNFICSCIPIVHDFTVLSNLQMEPYQCNNNCLLKSEDDIKWDDKAM